MSLARQSTALQVAFSAGFTPQSVGFANAGSVARSLLTPLTSTLVHYGLLHLLVTMLGLLVCGRIVESIVGRGGMILLYLAGAFAAAAAHYAVAPHDPRALIGAGGAVSAVIGAYAMLLGRNKLRVAGPARGLWLNALWLAAAWIVIQALLALAYGVPLLQIPFAALAGGFLVGLALAKPLLQLRWRGA